MPVPPSTPPRNPGQPVQRVCPNAPIRPRRNSIFNQNNNVFDFDSDGSEYIRGRFREVYNEIHFQPSISNLETIEDSGEIHYYDGPEISLNEDQLISRTVVEETEDYFVVEEEYQIDYNSDSEETVINQPQNHGKFA
tara:strand:- start:416 stop:826 length:411 start_codon:yes stop_codon:yes gene_type:complete